MIATGEFLLRTQIDAATLDAWIEAGWLEPRQTIDSRRFSEIDIVRARLIRDLKRKMGVNDEGVSVVLDLIDQVHGLRRVLRDLLSALHAEPEATRQKLVAGVGAMRSRRHGPDELLLGPTFDRFRWPRR